MLVRISRKPKAQRPCAKVLLLSGANLRYIILCRVSSGRQQIQGNSLVSQLAWIRTWILGSIASGAPREVYKVCGSVFHGVPRAIKAIFKAARSGDTILVYMVDRLGRNSSLFVPWLEKLRSRGVDVRSTSESLSYSTNREEFLKKLKLAEAVAEGMSARAKDAHRGQKRRSAEEASKGLTEDRIFGVRRSTQDSSGAEPCGQKEPSTERGCIRQMTRDHIEEVVLSEFKRLPPQLIAKAFATQKHVINLIHKYNGYNDYIKERSALHSGVRGRLIVREGGAVSPRDIFQMATHGDRFRHFFEEENIEN